MAPPSAPAEASPPAKRRRKAPGAAAPRKRAPKASKAGVGPIVEIPVVATAIGDPSAGTSDLSTPAPPPASPGKPKRRAPRKKAPTVTTAVAGTPPPAAEQIAPTESPTPTDASELPPPSPPEA